MANEVKIRVTAENASTPVIKGVQEGLEGVETAADKAGNGLRNVDRELEIMDKRVVSSRMELKRLAHEFANVDDEASRIDISKAMAKVQRDISRATRAQRALKFSDLIPSEPDSDSASRFASSLMKMSTAAGTKVGPILGSSIGIAAAPMLATAIAGGIIGGVGLGGVAGGFAIVSKDQRVKSAIKGLGDGLQDRLRGSVETFIPAAVGAIGTIEKSLKNIDFEGIFASAARFVDPLAKGVGRMIEGLGNGIEDVMREAGPAVEAISDGLGALGEAAGRGLTSLADDGEEAADSLRDLFSALELVTDATFGLINGAMELNEGLKDLGYDPAYGLHLLEKAFGKTDKAFSKNAASAEEAAEATDKFREASEDLSNELKSQTDPVFALVKAQDDLEKSQKAVTKAVDKFGKNSPEAKQALRDLAMNALETQAAAGKLGDTFDGKLTPELRATLRAAGMTSGEIGQLENQFKEAKREGDRFSKRYDASMRVNGTGKALSALYEARRMANSLDGRSIDIAMRVTGTNSVSAARHAYAKQYAHGGIVGAAANGATSNGLTLVGENGPELAEIKPGGRVWSNPDTQRMLSGQGSGQGGPITVNLVVDGRTLANVMVEPMRARVNRDAGGSAQQFWGRS